MDQQAQRRVVGRVDVLQDDGHRTEIGQERPDRLEEPQPRPLRVVRRDRLHPARQERADLLGQDGAGRRVREVAQHLLPRPQGGRRLVVRARPPPHRDAGRRAEPPEQARLADTRLPVHEHDLRGRGRRLHCAGQELQRALTSHERPVVRASPRVSSSGVGSSGGRRGGPRRRGQRGVLAQHGGLQLAQPEAGIDAQLARQHLAHPAQALQRRRLTARPIVSQREQFPGPLPQRVVVHERFEPRDHVRVAAQLQQRLRQSFDRVEPELLQTGDLRPRPLLGPHVGVRVAPPQGERLGEHGRRPLVPSLAQVPRPRGHEHVEVPRVEVDPAGHQAVPVGRADQDRGRSPGLPAGLQAAAQVGDVHLKAALRARGRAAAPEPVGQHVRREHPIGVHHEEGQERSLLGRPGRHGLPRHDEFHGTEDVQPHGPMVGRRREPVQPLHPRPTRRHRQGYDRPAARTATAGTHAKERGAWRTRTPRSGSSGWTTPR